MTAAAPPAIQSTKRQLMTRWGFLKTERASWVPQWQDITKFILPWGGRYFAQDRNRGNQRINKDLLDNTATDALFTLAAGLMAGATSPARPWFKLKTGDPDLDAYQPVRLWLDNIETRMRAVFQSKSSNTYRVLHQMYLELGAFGTSASVMLPDREGMIYHYPVTVGEYAIAADAKCRVDTFYREFEMTARNMVKQFGIKNCSGQVQSAYRNQGQDQPFTVVQAIEPRSDRKAGKSDNLNMEWRSVYFELANGDDLLSESGFDYFPVLAPRWSTFGGDVYGNSPGMRCLGDIKGLQLAQLRKGQSIDFMTKPAFVGPPSMKNKDIDLFPGGMTLAENTGNSRPAVTPLFQPTLSLRDLGEDMAETRDRINRAFSKDLFLLITNSNDSQKTVPEIAERREEKMMVLGPLLESLQTEMQEPLIANLFRRMLETNSIPPAPQELNGMELRVEFNGVLAQAQVAIGMNSVDRFTATLGHIATFKPDVLDKFDADAWVDAASDMLGVPPQMIVAGDKVALIRTARAKAMAAKEQAAAMAQTASTTKDLAAAPTGPGQKTALTDLLNQYSGYGSPTPAGNP
jgi:hypothetical protein